MPAAEYFRGGPSSRLHMMRWACLAAVLLLCSVPGAVSQEPSLEIVDGVQDVKYSQFYAGARDHNYLDLVSVDFSANETVLRVSVNVMDTRALERPPEMWGVDCRVVARPLAAGTNNGVIYYGWTTYNHNQRVASSVVWYPAEGAVAQLREIRHSLEWVYAAPGSFTWIVPLAEVAAYGEVQTRFEVECQEGLSPAANAPPTAVFNQDSAANASGSFALDYQPAEPGPGKSAPGSRVASATESSGKSPSATFAASLIAALIGVAWTLHRRS